MTSQYKFASAHKKKGAQSEAQTAKSPSQRRRRTRPMDPRNFPGTDSADAVRPGVIPEANRGQRLDRKSPDFDLSATSEDRSRIVGHGASRGHVLDRNIQQQVENITGIGLEGVRVRSDLNARKEADDHAAYALTRGDEILLGSLIDTPLGPSRTSTLRHEAIHAAQIRLGRSLGYASSQKDVERQARWLTANSQWPGTETDLLPASDQEIYKVAWIPFIAGGAAAAYILLRPNVANAPGPGDELHESVSSLQIAGEGLLVGVLTLCALQGALALGIQGISATAVRSYIVTHWKAMGISGLTNALGNIAIQSHIHGTDWERWNLPSIFVDLVLGAISYGVISHIIRSIPVSFTASGVSWYMLHQHAMAFLRNTPALVQQQIMVILYAIFVSTIRGPVSNVDIGRSAGSQYAAGTTQFFLKNAVNNYFRNHFGPNSNAFADWRVALGTGTVKILNKWFIRLLFDDVPSSNSGVTDPEEQAAGQ